MIHCSNCLNPYPETSAPFRCRQCGGIFDFSDDLVYDHKKIDSSLPGIWKYRQSFNLPEDAPVVSLGEGNTPLVFSKFGDRDVAFKLEFLNPTGSFKDRGTAPLVSFLKSRGVAEAVEDSSGNAGASFAAYASAAGIKARVFVPEYASGPKRAQISAFGAEVVGVPGPRSSAADAVLAAAADGAVYASHAFMPHDILGYATVAYELFEQLGTAPGAVIAPTGQGTLLLGVGHGFRALRRSDVIKQMPMLVGVQARACAPLWASFAHGEAGYEQVEEGQTIAEGIRVRHPLRKESLLEMVRSTNGYFVAVEEDAILKGWEALAHRGFLVEPTSAIVWNALEQVVGTVPEPIVLILTGSGLKATHHI